MIKSIPLSRAAAQVAILALGMSVSAPACPAAAFTPSGPRASGENVPLNLPSTSASAHSSSGGPSIVRTIVGLLIVIAVIWGLTWILRQVKSGRATQAAGMSLSSLATLPLGSNRSLHLVRAGSDYLLVGSAEQGVVPVHRYTEQQAREAGLLQEQPSAEEIEPPAGDEGPRLAARLANRAGGASAARRSAGAIQIPGQGHSLSQSVLARLREWTVRR
jgi:flagellar protein FliO/FliZ